MDCFDNFKPFAAIIGTSRHPQLRGLRRLATAAALLLLPLAAALSQRFTTKTSTAFPGGFPPKGIYYDSAIRIYPVQLYYIRRAKSYFYLSDADLMNRLSPPIGPTPLNFRPDYDAWRKLKSRFLIRKEGAAVHRLNNGVTDWNENTFLQNNLFQF